MTSQILNLRGRATSPVHCFLTIREVDYNNLHSASLCQITYATLNSAASIPLPLIPPSYFRTSPFMMLIYGRYPATPLHHVNSAKKDTSYAHSFECNFVTHTLTAAFDLGSLPFLSSRIVRPITANF
jgi:hypothetical protein